VVVSQLSAHSAANRLLQSCQSAYRRYHSTETAVFKLNNDIARATGSGFVSAHVLLDLSAAFDTVDFGILLDVQRNRFGVQSSALECYRSYLSDRSQTVVAGSATHGSLSIHCGVPQGSVIGPNGFVAYTEELGEIISKFSITFHLYADDTGCLSHMPLADITSYWVSVERCLVEVRNWFWSRRLQLNADKSFN
jgi:Reverse transcriptase (RNA-dependent DNA polymerase)